MNVALPPARVCSLFSGYGGLDLGLELAFGSHAVVYVEREAFAAAALVARMGEAALADAPIWSDIATFDGRPWRGVVDCVAGGSPCQDLSVAGKRAGLDGERSGLFWQFVRIVGEVEPAWVVWENVGGAARVLPRVCEAFEGLGYRGAVVKVRASDVGAPHERARFFLLAHRERCSSGQPKGGGSGQGRPGATVARHDGLEVAHADVVGRSQPGGHERHERRRAQHGGASMADANGSRRHWSGAELGGGTAIEGPKRGVERPDIDLADAESARRLGRWWLEGRDETQLARPPLCGSFPPGPRDAEAWANWAGPQPGIRRSVDGSASGVDPAPYRLDRLRALGNGVVPQQAAAALRFLFEHLTGDRA